MNDQVAALLKRVRDGWPPKPEGVLFNLHDDGIVQPPVYYAGKRPNEDIRVWYVVTPVPLSQLVGGMTDIRIGKLPARTSISIVNSEHVAGDRTKIVKTILGAHE